MKFCCQMCVLHRYMYGTYLQNMVRLQGKRIFTQFSTSSKACDNRGAKPTKNAPGKAAKPKKFTVLPVIKEELLFGIFPVLLALQQNRRQFHQMFLKETFRWTVRSDLKELMRLAEEKSVPIHYHNVFTLDRMSRGNPHQGVCADVSKKKFTHIETEKTNKKNRPNDRPELWLLLNNIQDPMNFGAVLRSAYFFGVDKIVTVKRDSCRLSPVVSKASAGALELMDVFSVQDDVTFIQQKKSEKDWRILGTGSSSEAGVRNLNALSLDTNTILMIGNEGQGLSSDLTELCDHIVCIPAGHTLHQCFDSLNVSVATGILLHHFLGQKTSH